MSLTNKQVIEICRKEAKNNALTFKIQPNIRINGGSVYMFIDRKTKARVLSNCTLGGAYSNVCSGFVDSYDAESRTFKGI